MNYVAMDIWNRTSPSQFIEHHGVKGMKWGVRHDQRREGFFARRRRKKLFKRDFRETQRIAEKNSRVLPERAKIKSQIQRMDNAERRRHPGYEYGDMYVPDFDRKYLDKSNKKDAKLLKYSELIDRDEAIGEKYVNDTLLKKYGATNLKDAWNKENFVPIKIDKSDSSVTKKVKKDYNTISDKEFFYKYQATKQQYAKRVEKYGDPYMNSPLAKLGKAAEARQASKREKAKAKVSAQYKKQVDIYNRQALKNIAEYNNKYGRNVAPVYNDDGAIIGYRAKDPKQRKSNKK